MPVNNKELISSMTSLSSEVLDKHGITRDRLAEELVQELEAEETKFFVINGEIQERSVPAWSIRQNARRDGQRIHGDYGPDQHEVAAVVLQPAQIKKDKQVNDLDPSTGTQKSDGGGRENDG